MNNRLRNLYVSITLLSIISSFSIGYGAYRYSQLKKEYDRVYADNCVLINMFEDQEKTKRMLIRIGWTKEKAETFVANGCLNYIKIGE